MKVVFAGGGTGGHVFPIVAIAREMKKRIPPNAELVYIGPKDDYSKDTLSQEGIKTHFILSGKLRRYFSIPDFFSSLVDIFFKVPAGIVQALSLIFFIAPDLIFSKGGYGSIPVVIAGWLLGVPVFLHESDIVPGLANKLLSKFSSEIFVSFPVKETEYFPLKKMIQVGNPIRKELLEGSSEKAKELFKLKKEKPVILVLGGSQGSQRINELMMEILPELLGKFEIIHQTGAKDFPKIQKEAVAFIPEALRENYHPLAFLSEEELKHAYSIADCVISRAGSGTIFELAALKKPSVLIPLPESAQNHQVKNAYAYSRYNACLVLEEGNLSPHFFLEKLNNLFLYNYLQEMKLGAEKFAKPNASDVIARYLLEFLE
jgi:UDP-N-acetylglucosamine--N-acetylmuramyl-(pentapeptide) pyrophosphoryl-undecaprenol N-acetylglucosamine transferase